MAALTHPEARALIQAEADQLVSGAQSRDLNEHLRTCPECRAYRAELAAVATALPRAFQARWGGGPQSSTATLAGVLAGARPRPAAPAAHAGRLGLNRLGLATGLLSLLIVTGAAAAMTLRDQSGSFAGLFGLLSEQTATATEQVEHPEASATPSECRERCDDQTPAPSATRRECGEDCATRVSEPSQTPTPHEPEATRPPTGTHRPEASRTPRPTVNEPSRTPTNTPHEPEASTTPPEPEASSTPHEPEASNTAHEPEHTAEPTKTHAPEQTATPSNTPHEPEPTATKTPGAEPTATSTQI